MLIHILVYTSEARPSPVQKMDIAMLAEAAKKQGHEIEVIYSPDCQLGFTKKPHILVKNKRPKNINILLIKASFLGTDLDLHSNVIKQFQLSGISVVNDHLSVIRAKNKVRTMQVLNRNGVPTPKTYVARSSRYIEDVVERIGSLPVIIKNISGSHGSGVSIVETKNGLRSIAEMIIENMKSGSLIVQEYVKESKGKDIRVFVVGGKIVAAMQRIAANRDEFRSNFKLGGKVRIAELTAKEKRMSLAATDACGLEMAGVDILRTNSGPKVLEVNANPGLEGITQATGVDVAGAIIKYTATKAKREMGKKKKKS
ncbi:MAG: RimK family alpha-L-glutamate ligase [Candidatus Magasanikbacteria bacterium]|jgi:ribosomal protein S6--L-glutamate ligase|nr:RimK family alpha-L-glutamate ligase [Candidatus Magasanikbacteria bacterium]MBT4315037.1 RimK family alpha-L-glutamate ligase [Candidatus Magasanikbacteria bacterium]MBT4546816.1 RimK family alpha-L-glutamate ligase [Candidatus Magasanikbacteria bacterium]MBT6818981.1 RimK family alpha-L-glutamate ligase [Candidatus Magasanikbacteria bacterium]